MKILLPMHGLKTNTDAELLQLLGQGYEPAFVEIYDRYWTRLCLRAEKWLKQRHVAQDAVQDVFMGLWKHPAHATIHMLENYLFQAIRFQVCKILRKTVASRKFIRYTITVSPGHTTGDPIIARELHVRIERVLKALPGDQRKIFHLHRNECLTYKEIAARCGISVKTVEKKISLSLRRLRKEV
jgi:RNA polymerase sigma-70 factor (ECF subfamily)